MALDKLGPGYTWKTNVYSDQPANNGHIKGNLYIKGHGDPFMTAEHFWLFLRDIRQNGVENIHGDLVLDTSYFMPEPQDPAEFDGKPYRSYNVSPNALLVNFQSIRFRFSPNQQNSKLVITPFPKLKTFNIENKISIRRGRCGNWKQRLLMQIIPQLDQDQIRFSGQYSLACGERTFYRAVNNTPRYFEGIFRQLWQEQGGQLAGRVRLAQVPTQATQLHSRSSLPLADLVRSINKYSNNVMTRQLLLTLGAEILYPPGTTKKGIKVIKSWMQEHRIFSERTILDNGAGLSRDTRISASQLARLLLHVYQQPFMPEFISSLPANAVDGTMSHRLVGADMQGHMHIKTGTLDYVRSMAGYVLSKTGKRYVVVMLHNHPRAHTFNGEKLQDALLNWVYQR